MQKSAPIVGIIMNERLVDTVPTYTLSAKYAAPIINVVKAAPILLPPLGADTPYNAWLSVLDGIVFTGSPSDVHPRRYNDTIKNPRSYFDENRDETSLGLIRAAVDMKLPILGICRGFQEINVALGGTLLQSLHVTPEYLDHREVEGDSYGFRHRINIVPQGKLSKMSGISQLQVNSLHDQGVDILADRLQAEAHAEDGLIEAFSLKDSDQFLFATQWHIEWKPETHPCAHAILSAFGAACAAYKTNK